jgi:nitrate reductase (NAD(P)H)
LVGGTDATEEFDAIHSQKAKAMLKDYYIGELTLEGEAAGSTTDDSASTGPDNSEGAEDDVNSDAPVALEPRKKLSLPLIEKHELSHNVRRFRFGLPTPNHRFGLPVGKHVFISARINGELVMRAYTPSSSDRELGYFDLVIKVYFANEHPKFPEGGKVSQYLESLAIGDTVDVKGPLGHMEYTGRGRYLLDREPRRATHMSMIAGGTGITPMYKVIKDVLRRGDDVQLALLYANQTPDDILLREELDELAATHDNFRVWYTVDRAPEDWAFSTGFIDEAMVREHLCEAGEGRVALLCGPPPMIKFACVPNLEKLGYDDSTIIAF